MVNNGSSGGWLEGRIVAAAAAEGEYGLIEDEAEWFDLTTLPKDDVLGGDGSRDGSAEPDDNC